MAGDSDPGPRLTSRLTYLLKRALVDLEELHRVHLAPLGITGRELGVLLHLDGHEPESQQQAAARLGVDRTTMVALLDTLEDAGFVVRRPDAADRRRNVVEVTAAGRRAVRTGLRASDRAEQQLLDDLTPAEQSQLRAALQRVAAGHARHAQGAAAVAR